MPSLSKASGDRDDDRQDDLRIAAAISAAVADDPAGHLGQAAEPCRRQRQFMRLSGRERKGDHPPRAIAEHARLGAIAAARAAERLAPVTRRAVGPPFFAPAALA